MASSSQSGNENTTLERPSRREIFDTTLSGLRERPFIPLLRVDKHPIKPVPRSLPDYRQAEGAQQREVRLKELWRQLPKRLATPLDDGHHEHSTAVPFAVHPDLTPERAEKLREMYVHELVGRCSGHGDDDAKEVTWPEFSKYADTKEKGEFAWFLR